ncbi:MAG: hypothetical protein HZA03_11985 [Nitrospinae bacterium]|nr:hypothetical protein [Nitrospinota bacterium]
MKKKPLATGRIRPATFAPYMPAGVIEIGELEKLVARLKESGAEKVKFGGEMVFVWEGHERPHDPAPGYESNNFKAPRVRPVRLCSAEVFCQRYKRPVLALAREIDKRFRGTPLPVKLHIGIAGCPRSCSEPAVKDIGIIAHNQGYEILLGGSAGLGPVLAQSAGLANDEEAVLAVIKRVITYMQEGGKKMRLGRLIAKIGRERFLEESGLATLLLPWQTTDEEGSDAE